MLEADAMLLVWESLTGIFGQPFLSNFGDDPNGATGLLWADALSGLTRTQLHRGLNACATTRTAKYPPNLPEFRALCLAGDRLPGEAPEAGMLDARARLERDADIAHFTRMRELAKGLGLDLWEREAIHGVRRSTRPPPRNPERVKQFMADIQRIFR